MDYFFIGNALLYLSAFAMQFGLLDFGDDTADDDVSEADETTETGPDIFDIPAYDASAYGAETIGTPDDDSFDATSSLQAEAFFLGAGNDALDATFHDDFASGGDGDDTLIMRPGDDVALGGDGNDSIDGGFGNDSLFGEAGNDWINGSKGDDIVSGGDGDDTLMGSDGSDQLNGGAGNDALYGNLDGAAGETEDGADTLLGGDGDDALHLAGGDSGSGGAGADSFLLYDPGDSGAVSTVDDYDPSEDMLGVIYTPATDPLTGDPVTPVITVAASDEGDAGIVSLDGIEVARIAGGQDLTAADIALIADDA